MTKRILARATGVLVTAMILGACTTVAPTVTENETIPDVNFSPVTSASYDKTWTTNIGDLKSAIRACMLVKKDTAVITYAIPMNKGKALVNLRTRSGENYECIADLGTAKVDRITADNVIIPDDVPKFYPVGRPVGKCSAAMTKKDASGRVMGTVCS